MKVTGILIITPKGLVKGQGDLEISEDYSEGNILKIGQNTEKSTGDFWEDLLPLKLHRKTIS